MKLGSDPNRDDFDAWGECPPGELDRMVGRVRSQRAAQRLRTIAPAVTVVVVALVVGGVVLSRFGGPAEPRFGGIACSEVQPLLGDYAAGRLDARRAEQMRIHLSECPMCSRMHESLISSAMTPGSAVAPISVAAARTKPTGRPTISALLLAIGR